MSTALTQAAGVSAQSSGPKGCSSQAHPAQHTPDLLAPTGPTVARIVVSSVGSRPYIRRTRSGHATLATAVHHQGCTCLHRGTAQIKDRAFDREGEGRGEREGLDLPFAVLRWAESQRGRIAQGLLNPRVLGSSSEVLGRTSSMIT